MKRKYMTPLMVVVKPSTRHIMLAASVMIDDTDIWDSNSQGFEIQ